MSFKSKKLRDSARGMDCTMNVHGICSYNNETTVLSHINTEGGCMGGKSDDFSAVFSCAACHSWLDQNIGTELDRLFYTRRALIKTWRVWIENGLFKI